MLKKICVWIICILVSLEIGLQAGGLIVRSWWFAQHAFYAKRPGEITVLCVGDSITQGVGADARGRSYPAQLEKMLYARFPDKRIRVVNYGIGGTNSSQLLHRLPGLMLQFDPDILICLIGQNDGWNLIESGLQHVNDSPLFASIAVHARTWVFNLKTYKLYQAARFIFSPRVKDIKNRTIQEIEAEDGSVIDEWKDEGKDMCGHLIRSNIEKIIDISEEKGVMFVGLTYPEDKCDYLNDLLKTIYERNDVAYVDIFRLFPAFERKRGGSLFIADGFHLTGEGYEKFAELLLPLISKAIRTRFSDHI